MRFRLIGAVSVAAMASLVASGTQAAVLLMSFGAPVGGWADPTGSQTNVSIEVGPGALSLELNSLVSVDGPNVAAGGPAAALSRPATAPSLPAAADFGLKTAEAASGNAVVAAGPGAKPESAAASLNLGHDGPEEAQAAVQMAAGPGQDSDAEATLTGDRASAAFDAGSQGLGVAADHVPAILVPPSFVPSFVPAFVTSVPEPTSWALMVVGFGGLGAMLRRRRSPMALAL